MTYKFCSSMFWQKDVTHIKYVQNIKLYICVKVKLYWGTLTLSKIQQGILENSWTEGDPYVCSVITDLYQKAEPKAYFFLFCRGLTTLLIDFFCS